MANICTNIFYCSTESRENLKKVEEFLDTNFYDWDCWSMEEDDFIEGLFDSNWVFPEELFEELIKDIGDDDSLYIRVLSYEFGLEYAGFRIYRNNDWDITF